MQLHLENQTAVVIGGASGIGLAIAQEFAREGCRIAILDRSEHTASQAQQILARSASEGWPSSTSIGLRADVTDYSAIQTAARQIETTLGPPHHVIYAAGMGSGKFGFPFWNLEPKDWDRVYQVNLLGAVHAAHAFAPALVEHKRGTMLFISSVAGQANVAFRFHYAMGTGGGGGVGQGGQAWDWYAQVDDLAITAASGPGPGPSVVEVPTLSEIGLGGLALLLAGAGFLVLRRQG